VQLLTYGIIGFVRVYNWLPQQHPHLRKSIWPVAARFNLEEAEAYMYACVKQAAVFNGWLHNMQLNNPEGKWADLTQEYIENRMLDKQFEHGAEYEILCFKEDSAQ
jgi:hypothetical protein